MAIIDDIDATIVVALGCASSVGRGALALAAPGIAGVRAMAMLGVRSIALYFRVRAATGLVMDNSGIHATITGVILDQVILDLLPPARRWVRSHACCPAYGGVLGVR